jgi:glycosyltransferase involved in cell wall biosynthesis
MSKLRIAFLTTDGRENLPEKYWAVPSLGSAPEALLEGFKQLADAEVHLLSCARQPKSWPDKLADNIFFHSLQVPKTGWIRTGYQGCVRAVRKKLKEIRPDIVHGQGTERDCAISAAFSGYPNVITIHGNMRLVAELNRAKPFSYSWFVARLEAFTIPRTDGVVCITHYTREAVKGLAKKTWVLPNAVFPTFFDIERKPPAEAPLILCVGAICYRKNQNALIRALDPLAAKRRFNLFFSGNVGPNDPYSQEFLGLVRARPWCSYDGFAERGPLQQLMQSASLLVLPSREDNCPMVVLEAMAAGVPVVAAKVGGVPDLIEPGKTGLFCDPDDPSSMKDAVENALAQPGLAQTLAANAKNDARARFHPLVIARHHLEIYRELLNNRS